MNVTLYDLMFYTFDGHQYTRYTQNPDPTTYKCTGFELPHSTIIFDPKLYQWNETTGQREIKWYDIDLNPFGPSFDDFIKRGIDLAVPSFDYRSKPLFVTPSNINKHLLNSKDNTATMTALINAWAPERLAPNDFYYNPANTINAGGFKIWDKDAILFPDTSYDFYVHSVLANGNQEPNSIYDYPVPFVVGVEEDALEMKDLGFQKNKPDIILSNRDYSFEKRFIDPQSGQRAYNTICVNFRSANIWKNLFALYNVTQAPAEVTTLITLMGNTQVNDGTQNAIIMYLLKNCHVMIKCSFFGDYVDYRDFNQTLNKHAQVVHNNLLLTKDADFNRYDRAYSTEGNINYTDKEEYSRPWYPSVTPSIDLIRDRIKHIMVGANMTNQLKSLIEDANDPNSEIGAVPITPFENKEIDEKYPQLTSRPTGTAPIWFDPESRKDAADYSDYPIVVPKNGNAVIDGRILSPTIDEIWKMLKQLASGRRADSYAELNMELNDPWGGYPVGENASATTFDTRPSIRSHTVNKSSMIGDPTRIEIDENTVSLAVREWVNNPTKIKYSTILELRELNNILTEAQTIGFNNLDNITGPNVDNLSYRPNSTVMSLREVESMLKGLKWNLSYFMRYFTANGVWAGSLGRDNTDAAGHTAGRNKSAGTAYQLHKAYNPNVAGGYTNPNTVYDERLNHTGAVPSVPGIGVSPIVEGQLDNSQEMIPPHTVFMSAAGTWQSVSQCMNIRIRDDELF
jgi:hypothetical protein